MELARPLLIYDGDCDFCGLWIAHWKALTGERVDYAPFQEVESRFPQIPHETFERGVQLVMPDGTVYHNSEAVFRLLKDTPGRGWRLWMYQHVPGVRPVTEGVYRLVRGHRNFGYATTKLLWGSHIGPHTYMLTRWLFLRALALIYFIVFASLSVQIIGLVGEHGILPAGQFMERVAENVSGNERYLVPTLTWFNTSDAFLQFLCTGGMALSVLLLFDVLAVPVMILLWLFYSSLVIVGQSFLSFQWDILLLETGFLATFLGSTRLLPGLKRRTEPSMLVIWLFRWELFRLMFSSGVVKLASGDPTWHNLNAMDYHYWTQPIPNPIAWYMDKLPHEFDAMSVQFTFFVELLVPFLYFMPRRIRFVGALFTIALQLLILTTGNFAFFNWLTIALCIPLLDDDLLRRFFPKRAAEAIINTAVRPQGLRLALRRIVVAVVAVALVTASLIRIDAIINFVAQPIFHERLIVTNRLPDPVLDMANTVFQLHIIGGYGLFANMTTSRPEIIIEGSNDGETWLPYEFTYKPGDLNRPPPFVAPHQPRLDWQMWFAALGSFQNNPWFVALAHRLLEGTPEVLALLAHNPFPDAPPRYLRATVYNYRFSDWDTRNETGAWWTRSNPREYLPVITLESFR
jgi:lipase maturation factor 1